MTKKEFIKFTRGTGNNYLHMTKKEFIVAMRETGNNYLSVVSLIEKHDEDGWGEDEGWELYSLIECIEEFASKEHEERFIAENKEILDEMVELGWFKNLYNDEDD